MKKTLFLIALGLFLTFNATKSYAVVIGTKVSGVPVISISSSAMNAQLSALSGSGFSAIVLISMSLTPTISGNGIFTVEFSYLPPGGLVELHVAKCIITCVYNAGTNEYIATQGDNMYCCDNVNCSGCTATTEGGCSSCTATNPDTISRCKVQSHMTTEYPLWGPTFITFLNSLEMWLKS